MNKILITVIVIFLIGGGYYYFQNNQTKTMEQQNLETIVLEEGSGDPAQVKDKLTVHYTGYLEDGTKFDSSYDRNNPFVFTLGIGQVIQGWDKGMEGVKVGEKRKIIIPSHLAYGEEGMKNQLGDYIIPPNATLTFEVEILKIQ
jgi:FKBP-type peptidyl-prolyl cis-trans isomerase